MFESEKITKLEEGSSVCNLIVIVFHSLEEDALCFSSVL